MLWGSAALIASSTSWVTSENSPVIYGASWVSQSFRKAFRHSIRTLSDSASRRWFSIASSVGNVLSKTSVLQVRIDAGSAMSSKILFLKVFIASYDKGCHISFCWQQEIWLAPTPDSWYDSVGWHSKPNSSVQRFLAFSIESLYVLFIALLSNNLRPGTP